MKLFLVLLAGTVALSVYSTLPRLHTYPARNACNDELIATPSTLRTKPAISWPGGKSRFLDRILPLIPEHTCYCEPFAGGLAVLLAKPRSRLEVINDANGDLITFYRCVRFHADVLLTELEFVLNSRQEFHDFCHQPGLTDIQRAARWYFRNKTCFGGARMDSFGPGGPANSSRAYRMEAIRALNARLDRTTIENLDWQRCLTLYNRPDTFFFCDPPYTECNAGMYPAWTNTDVQLLGEREQAQIGHAIAARGGAVVALAGRRDPEQARQVDRRLAELVMLNFPLPTFAGGKLVGSRPVNWTSVGARRHRTSPVDICCPGMSNAFASA